MCDRNGMRGVGKVYGATDTPDPPAEIALPPYGLLH